MMGQSPDLSAQVHSTDAAHTFNRVDFADNRCEIMQLVTAGDRRRPSSHSMDSTPSRRSQPARAARQKATQSIQEALQSDDLLQEHSDGTASQSSGEWKVIARSDDWQPLPHIHGAAFMQLLPPLRVFTCSRLWSRWLNKLAVMGMRKDMHACRSHDLFLSEPGPRVHEAAWKGIQPVTNEHVRARKWYFLYILMCRNEIAAGNQHHSSPRML